MIKYILTHKYVVAVFVAFVVFCIALVQWQIEPPDIQVGIFASAQDIALEDSQINVPAPTSGSPWFYPLIVSAIMIVNTAVNGYFETKKKNFNQLEQEKSLLQGKVELLEREREEVRIRREREKDEAQDKMLAEQNRLIAELTRHKDDGK
jgi:hypothetical protein